MGNPNQYAETAALLAVMEEDWDRARELIADFYPTELGRFEDQVDKLVDMIGAEQRRRAVAQ